MKFQLRMRAHYEICDVQQISESAERRESESHRGLYPYLIPCLLSYHLLCSSLARSNCDCAFD